MNLFNQKYHIQIYMRRLQLEKNKNKKINKNVRCKKDSMERPLVNICMCGGAKTWALAVGLSTTFYQ